MFPEFLPPYSIGPFIGFITYAVLSLLSLMILLIYRAYRPLWALFTFYLLSTLLFFGWLIYSFQRSPLSILSGYRIDLASLALLPPSWIWFVSSLTGKRIGRLSKWMIGLSLLLAFLALVGQGPWFLGLPLESHQVDPHILRPQSKVLKPAIYLYCFLSGLFYSIWSMGRVFRSQTPKPVYFLPIGIGLLLWFLGGLHDGLRSMGVVILVKPQILWLTSFWLSLSLTMAVTLHFHSLEKTVRETRDVFEKFVPPAYLRRIATHGLGSIRLGKADLQEVTILCADIRGFTQLSAQLHPDELIQLVNRLYGELSQTIERWQGVIDKFLGDALLCIFEGEDSSWRALACGVEILSETESFNRTWSSSNHSIQIGIGIHRGPAVLGTIGSSRRMDSTVLGLTVNLAKRLEELTQPKGAEILISKEVAQSLPSEHPYCLRHLGEVSVKGNPVPMSVFEVIR
jgi:class 3 adenylate cyclase